MSRNNRSPRRHSLTYFLMLLVLILAIIAFLLKLPYLPTGLIAVLTLLLVVSGYAFLRIHYGVSAPPLVIGLLVGAVGVDAIGNYLHLYGREFGPVMYDEFAHLAASALTMPAIVWLLNVMLEQYGHPLPLGLITLFAITCTFSAAALYEVIELWDELYFGGARIWGEYDAPRDLQWDLVGILLGAMIAYFLFRPSVHRR